MKIFIKNRTFLTHTSSYFVQKSSRTYVSVPVFSQNLLRLAQKILVFNKNLILLSVIGCSNSDVQEFTSPQALIDGMRGKSWGTSQYLELNASDPSVSTLNTSHLDFDLVGVSDAAYLAMTLYDTSTTRFLGYARRYTDGSGWHSPGAEFLSVAAPSATGLSLGHVGIAANADGSVVSALFSETAQKKWQSVLRVGGWRGPSALTFGGANDYTQYLATSASGFAPTISMAIDSTNKIYSLYHANVDTTDSVRLNFWEPASGLDVANQVNLQSANVGSGTQSLRKVQAVFDGKKSVCYLAEDQIMGTTQTLYSKCQDVSKGTVSSPSLTPSSGTPTKVSDGTTMGFEAASDGSGTILVVFYQVVSGKYQLMYNTASLGVWGGGPGLVNASMPTDYVAASPATQSAQGVAYLGEGKFIAVWVAQNTATQKSTLFSSIYDTKTAKWKFLGPLLDDVSSKDVQPFQSVHVFANGQLHAGVVASVISNATTGERKINVSRYHPSQGWLPMMSRGNGCVPGTSTLAYCTRRPMGAVFASGNAVVVYQDQDGSSRFRLAGVEFK